VSGLSIRWATSPDEEEFHEIFATFPQKVRKPPYDGGVLHPELTKQLLLWGWANGAGYAIVTDATGNVVMRFAARPSPVHLGVGAIGFVEIDLSHPNHVEAVRLALTHAETWLKERDVTMVVAPVDFNTWFTYRFSVKGPKFMPRSGWEPTTPPEYEALFRANGYDTHSQYNSVYFPHIRIGSFAPGTGHLKAAHERMKSLGYGMRPLDMSRFQEHELPLLHEISHEAFADAPLFEPIDIQTFSVLYAAGKAAYDISPSSILIAPDGTEVGFLFAFFDGKHYVIKSLAVRRKHQGKNVAGGLVYAGLLMAFERGMKTTVSALVRTGIASDKMNRRSRQFTWLAWTHDYILLKKVLP
jgi:GNAT superfamily N-acetyltransferase